MSGLRSRLILAHWMVYLLLFPPAMLAQQGSADVLQETGAHLEVDAHEENDAAQLQLAQQPQPLTGHPGVARSAEDDTGQDKKPTPPEAADPGQDAPPSKSPWQYGGFIDAAYLLDFNHPANHLFRSRGTAYKVDEPIMNMAMIYLRKPASESSRWVWN